MENFAILCKEHGLRGQAFCTFKECSHRMLCFKCVKIHANLHDESHIKLINTLPDFSAEDSSLSLGANQKTPADQQNEDILQMIHQTEAESHKLNGLMNSLEQISDQSNIQMNSPEEIRQAFERLTANRKELADSTELSKVINDYLRIRSEPKIFKIQKEVKEEMTELLKKLRDLKSRLQVLNKGHSLDLQELNNQENGTNLSAKIQQEESKQQQVESNPIQSQVIRSEDQLNVEVNPESLNAKKSAENPSLNCIQIEEPLKASKEKEDLFSKPLANDPKEIIDLSSPQCKSLSVSPNQKIAKKKSTSKRASVKDKSHGPSQTTQEISKKKKKRESDLTKLASDDISTMLEEFLQNKILRGNFKEKSFALNRSINEKLGLNDGSKDTIGKDSTPKKSKSSQKLALDISTEVDNIKETIEKLETASRFSPKLLISWVLVVTIILNVTKVPPAIWEKIEAIKKKYLEFYSVSDSELHKTFLNELSKVRQLKREKDFVIRKICKLDQEYHNSSNFRPLAFRVKRLRDLKGKLKVSRASFSGSLKFLLEIIPLDRSESKEYPTLVTKKSQLERKKGNQSRNKCNKTTERNNHIGTDLKFDGKYKNLCRALLQPLELYERMKSLKSEENFQSPEREQFLKDFEAYEPIYQEYSNIELNAKSLDLFNSRLVYKSRVESFVNQVGEINYAFPVFVIRRTLWKYEVQIIQEAKDDLHNVAKITPRQIKNLTEELGDLKYQNKGVNISKQLENFLFQLHDEVNIVVLSMNNAGSLEELENIYVKVQSLHGTFLDFATEYNLRKNSLNQRNEMQNEEVPRPNQAPLQVIQQQHNQEERHSLLLNNNAFRVDQPEIIQEENRCNDRSASIATNLLNQDSVPVLRASVLSSPSNSVRANLTNQIEEIRGEEKMDLEEAQSEDVIESPRVKKIKDNQGDEIVVQQPKKSNEKCVIF